MEEAVKNPMAWLWTVFGLSVFLFLFLARTHLGMFASPFHFCLVLYKYGDKIDSPRQIVRVLVSILVGLIFSPIRWIEILLYERKWKNTPLALHPIFIIGHWRSGTTHLHNLLSMDPQFGYLTTYQGVQINWCLSGFFRRVMASMLPKTRGFDSMAFEMDLPLEDEVGLLLFSPLAFYLAWWFPSKYQYFFETSIAFRGKDGVRGRQQFKHDFDMLLRKISYMNGGRQLILKSPTHTARMQTIMEIFPYAKFVHIHRNPYDIFFTSRQLWTMQFYHSLEANKTDLEWGDQVFYLFKQLMTLYFQQKHLIPVSQLIEISYSDLCKDPLQILQQIYSHLNIPNFSQAQPCFQSYLNKPMVSEHRKNQFGALPEAIRARINNEWAFVFKALNYPLVLSVDETASSKSHNSQFPQPQDQIQST